MKEAEPTLSAALKDHPDFDLIITGHSLGAGTAELITLSILFNKVDYIDPGSVQPTSIQILLIKTKKYIRFWYNRTVIYRV